MIYLQAQVVLDIYFYKQGYYLPIKFLIKKISMFLKKIKICKNYRKNKEISKNNRETNR